MPDLSVVIPGRNEMFFDQTVRTVLANIRGDTEVIAVADGGWPDPPLQDDPRLVVLQFPKAIGQRAATNAGARVGRGEYVMKLDAHCAVAEGFDVALVKPYRDGEIDQQTTTIPRMYNLHAFDWRCHACGHRKYQGPTPTICEQCNTGGPFTRELVWQPRLHRMTDFARFDANLHFQYWGAYKRRPQAQAEIADVMCCVGAGWMLPMKRYWELGGMDEAHGGWGQMGVELACKSWLSGGRQVVNKRTWFSHMFRTQGGDFGFPFPLSDREVQQARAHSRSLWMDGKWPGIKRPLGWLIDHFAPVPDWPNAGTPEPAKTEPTKGIVFYTDNRLDERIAAAVQRHLLRASAGLPIVSVSLKPMDFGQNIVLQKEPGVLTMTEQILAGLEALDTDVVFFCEHDMLYHPTHFDFTPRRMDRYYYNQATWKVDVETGRALHYLCNQTSGLVASRTLLVEHYRKRVARIREQGYDRNMGFEPGTHGTPRGVDDVPVDIWMSEVPNIDIRHGRNLSRSRWNQDQFRNKNTCLGWTEGDGVPGWGPTKGRFWAFLEAVTG